MSLCDRAKYSSAWCFLQDTDPGVRVAARRALEAMGAAAAPAVSELTRALQAGDEEVQDLQTENVIKQPLAQ